MFYTVVILLGGLDLLFWRWADGRLKPFGRPLLRWLVGFLVGMQFLVLASWIIFPGTLRRLGGDFWRPVSAWLYMWHLLVLPAFMALILMGYAGRWAFAGIRKLAEARGAGVLKHTLPRPAVRRAELVMAGGGGGIEDELEDEPSDGRDVPTSFDPSRRQFLGAAAAFVPQVALGGAMVASHLQAGKFRVRPLTVNLPGLPQALDGLTIAHVSDTHCGRFVRERELEQVVARTAELKPDLVVFTGDLIDFNISDLPMAISAMRQLETIAPLALCSGNHDLFDDPKQFHRKIRRAELSLLRDEPLRVRVRGQDVTLLGIDWGSATSPRSAHLEEHMDKVLSRRSGGGLEILLAHHPHAFDYAAAAGIPLTLAGHTHGGQIMLTPTLGAGRAFKYWSGLYEKGPRKLVVSNGVGNWFPLRINAPAEIVQITVRAEKS